MDKTQLLISKMKEEEIQQEVRQNGDYYNAKKPNMNNHPTQWNLTRRYQLEKKYLIKVN